MAPATEHECTCTTEGYSPDCPQAFWQGGKLLHTIDNEIRLKPRTYETGQIAGSTCNGGPDSIRQSLVKQAMLDAMGTRSDPFQYQETSPSDDGTLSVEPLRIPTDQCFPKDNPRYSSGDHLRMGNEGSIGKFRPLMFNGVSLTEATIGGYRLDIAALAKTAAEVLPLPPVALPLIFTDTDLNFVHHFFQGLEVIAGRDFIKSVTEEKKYSRRDHNVFSPLVKRLLAEGYRQGDGDLAVFVKRVLTSTFEIVPRTGHESNEDTFLVTSNFYGFQYIEGGMLCKDPDLKMWLQTAYNQYRLVWFNNFKSSGIPAFALEGVQDRYEAPEPATISRRMTESADITPKSHELEGRSLIRTAKGHHGLERTPAHHKRKDNRIAKSFW